MSFQDNNQQDPSQPLTLDRPQTDPNLPAPYPKPRTEQPAYQRAQPPPSLFNPNLPNRGPDLWGQSHWPIVSAASYPGMPQGSDMPSGLESYPTIAKSAGYLSRWGSDSIKDNAQQVSGLAMGFAPILDMLSKGAFSRNFNASSLNGIRIQQERLILEGEQLQQRHAQELSDYGSIIAKADALAKANPDRAAQFIEDAREELRFLAETKYRHGPLVAVLDSSGGLDAAKNFLNQEDAHFRDAWAGVTSLKKATGSTERDPDTAQEFGISQRGGFGGSGMAPGIFGPTPTGDTEKETDPRTPQTGTGSAYEQDLLKKSGASPQELEMARQLSMGQVPESYKQREKIPANQRTPLENRALSDVNRLQNQMTHDIEQAANVENPGNDPSITQRKLDRLKQINPALYAEVAGRGTYDLNPKDERLGDRKYINSLTKRFFPDFNEDNYDVMKEFKNDKSPARKVLAAADRALQPIANMLEDLKDMPETDSIPIARLREAIAGKITNAGQYRQLSIDTQQLAAQLSGITTGTGVVRVTVFQQRMNEMPAYVSPSTLRNILKREAADIWAGAVGDFQNNWQTTFKRSDLAPGMSKDIWKGYSAVLRMNPQTGELPAGSPPEFMTSSKRNTKGVKPEDAWTPMSAADQRRNHIEAERLGNNPDLYNPKSPDYAKLQHAYHELLSREVPLRYAPWLRPDMD